MVVKTYQRTAEGEGLTVGSEDSWIDDSGWWDDEGDYDEDNAEDDEDHSNHDLKFMFHIQVRG